MLKNILYKIKFFFILFFLVISKSYASLPVYDITNRFWEILKDPYKNLDTKIFADTKYTLSFEDRHKQTKEHILFIPKEKYTSFIDFADNASSDEMLDLFKTINNVVEKLKLNEGGYRLITNHSLTPGKEKNNDASQKIAHFHIHLAGGECLGLSAVGASEPDQPREKIDMTITHSPFGFSLNHDSFLRYITQNTSSELIFQDPKNGLRKIVAYKLPTTEFHLKQQVGFILLNSKGEDAYRSIRNFTQLGTITEVTTILKFISETIKKTSLYQTGFRLVINEGKDAWQSPPDIFQITVAGGVKMGETVTNVQSNRKPKAKGEPGNIAYHYEDIKALPHEHCVEKNEL